jgi:hypothetical protein
MEGFKMVAALPLHQPKPDVNAETKTVKETGEDIAFEAIESAVAYHKYFKQTQRQMRVLMAANALDTESTRHKYEMEIQHARVLADALLNVSKALAEQAVQLLDEYHTYLTD